MATSAPGAGSSAPPPQPSGAQPSGSQASGAQPNKRLQQTQAQVDEVVDIMRVNVEKVLERDQKLTDLDTRADALQDGARQFENTATRLKRKYWWQNCKMWLILIVVIIVIIIIIIVAVVTSLPKSNSSGGSTVSTIKPTNP